MEVEGGVRDVAEGGVDGRLLEGERVLKGEEVQLFGRVVALL